MCGTCGPRPEYLCMDGGSIYWNDDIKKGKKGNIFVPVSSSEVLDASSYKDRQIIKMKKNIHKP